MITVRYAHRHPRAPRAKDTRAVLALGIMSDMRAAGVAPTAETYFSLIQLIQMAGAPSDLTSTLQSMQVKEQYAYSNVPYRPYACLSYVGGCPLQHNRASF